MKKITYQIGIVMLSLVMMLAASCGRQEAQGSPPASETTASAVAETTAPMIETPICTEQAKDIYPFVTVRFCYANEGQAVMIMEDGSLLSLPYDKMSGDICDMNGKTVLNISALALGDILRISYGAEDGAGYPADTAICHVEKTADASDYVYEETGGMVVSVRGDSLLVHPRPQEVLDPAKADPKACYEIDLRGLPIVDAQDPAAVLTPSELKPGDFVRIECSGGIEGAMTDTPRKLADVFSIIRRACVTDQLTVTDVYEGAERVMLGDIALGRQYFDRGDVLDPAGKVVKMEDIRVGDLFEVQHDGLLTASKPARFGRIYVVRRVKTAKQIEMETAAQEAWEALTKQITLRGTVRVFANDRKLVWLGETSAPEEIGYFGCTVLGSRLDPIITDAATGQTLTWDDLKDGDYVAVRGSGGIAETAPSQWDTVYGITRLARLCLTGKVSATGTDGITVTLEDGTLRRVTVKEYYVRGVRFDIEHLLVGDTVRLDVNALNENEVYALHLIDREETLPEGAVSETFRVNIVSGRRVYMMRDLSYDTSQIRFDETGVAIYDGDVSFDVERIFHDADGSVRSAKQIRQGDLITVIHSGVMTDARPAGFETIYRIVRVAE